MLGMSWSNNLSTNAGKGLCLTLGKDLIIIPLAYEVCNVGI